MTSSSSSSPPATAALRARPARRRFQNSTPELVDLASRLAEVVCQREDSFTARNLATVAISLSKRIRDVETVEFIRNEVLKLIDDLEPKQRRCGGVCFFFFFVVRLALGSPTASLGGFRRASDAFVERILTTIAPCHHFKTILNGGLSGSRKLFFLYYLYYYYYYFYRNPFGLAFGWSHSPWSFFLWAFFSATLPPPFCATAAKYQRSSRRL